MTSQLPRFRCFRIRTKYATLNSMCQVGPVKPTEEWSHTRLRPPACAALQPLCAPGLTPAEQPLLSSVRALLLATAAMTARRPQDPRSYQWSRRASPRRRQRSLQWCHRGAPPAEEALVKLPRCTPPPAQPLAEVYALAFQHSLEAAASAASKAAVAPPRRLEP